ncbi:MAG: hypothetical protein WA082_05070 [Candidatus Moraniibacteriota bacterium]
MEQDKERVRSAHGITESIRHHMPGVTPQRYAAGVLTSPKFQGRHDNRDNKRKPVQLSVAALTLVVTQCL